MPLYEFRCAEHGHFELFRRMAESGEPAPCPQCGAIGSRYFRTPPPVFGDYPPYVSPASGRVISGRREREEDFRRTNTRPYEVGEWKDNVRKQQEGDRELDAAVDIAVEKTVGELRSN